MVLQREVGLVFSEHLTVEGGGGAGKRKGCRPGRRRGEPQGRGEGGRELGANPHCVSLLKSLVHGLMGRSKGPHCPGLPDSCLAGWVSDPQK